MLIASLLFLRRITQPSFRWVFGLTVVCRLYGEVSQLTYIAEVHQDKLIIATYNRQSVHSVDISDLVIDSAILGNRDPLNMIYDGSGTDFKGELLKKGLARVKSFESAPLEYREAQDYAKGQHLGIWRVPAADAPRDVRATEDGNPGSSVTDKALNVLSTGWSWVQPLFVWIVSAGLLTVFGQSLYKRFYIQRRTDVLIIGEPSVGKTALYKRLLDPSVERQELAGLTPSSQEARGVRNRFVPWGRFEMYPRLTDVPGNKFSSVWDRMLKGSSHALVVVLSPTKRQNLTGGLNSEDQKYMTLQLGYVQAYIQGGLGSRVTKKPKILVVFINKFDLFSKHPAGDSAASADKSKVDELFAEHIAACNLAAKSASLPIRVIVGSVLENWNCTEVIEAMGNALYGP
jgi:signal recognition particle receptor subunit beta